MNFFYNNFKQVLSTVWSIHPYITLSIRPLSIRPLSTNIAHCEVAISKKLNSRKQKCGNQIFKLDEARSAVSKGARPWKRCLFPEIYTAWNTDFQQFFIISHSNVFLNFGLKVCRWEKCLALCLANCSPA